MTSPIKREDFKVTPDTIIYILFSMLLLFILVSYKIGYKHGIMDEKIGWLEDKELKRPERKEKIDAE